MGLAAAALLLVAVPASVQDTSTPTACSGADERMRDLFHQEARVAVAQVPGRGSASTGHLLRVEPGSTNATFFTLASLVAHASAKQRVSTVCQTGLNTGVSAAALLCATGNHVTLDSYDIASHWYINSTERALNRLYPGRHTLTKGSSLDTVPQRVHRCDFVFVDGGHSFKLAFADLYNFRNLSRGATVVVDNCNVNGRTRPFGAMLGVNRAFREAVRRGLVQHAEQRTAGACARHAQIIEGVAAQCGELCVAKFT